MRIPSALSRLWEMSGKDFPRAPLADGEIDRVWNTVYDKTGLIFITPQFNYYDCSPTNSVTFATTGNDGVHFGWLLQEDISINECPIVMTVPPPEDHIIVGANFVDFLAAGCRYGYASLDGLSYYRDETIKALESLSYSMGADEAEIAMLNSIVVEFGIEPWKEVDAKISRLQVEFGHFIEFSGDP